MKQKNEAKMKREAKILSGLICVLGKSFLVICEICQNHYLDNIMKSHLTKLDDAETTGN